MRSIILMSGFTGCFKTTISNFLKQMLNLYMISSHGFGIASTSIGLPNNELRRQRYEKIFPQLQRNINQIKSTIIDFSFCFEIYLLKTIHFLKKQNIDDIKIIRLVSSNNKKICNRIIKRKHSKKNPSDEASHIDTLSIIQKADNFYSNISILEKSTTIMEFDVDSSKKNKYTAVVLSMN